MRTAQQTKNEIAFLREQCAKTPYNKKIKKKIERLESLLAYIESQPSKDYLYRQIEKINNVLGVIEKSIHRKYGRTKRREEKEKAEIKMLKSELCVSKMKAQLKNLEYILGVQ